MTARDIHPRNHPDAPRFEYDAVDGGTLVYAVRPADDDEASAPIERRLYGFADVTDWDAIRSELLRRGHDVGTLHQLPTLE